MDDLSDPTAGTPSAGGGVEAGAVVSGMGAETKLTASPEANPPTGSAAEPLASSSRVTPRRFVNRLERGGPPLWALPALAVGRVHPGLTSETRDDIRLFDALPVARAGLAPRLTGYLAAALALVITLVYSFFRLGIQDVYTEQLAFLILGLAFGLLSPALGVLFVLFHVLLNAIVVFPRLSDAYLGNSNIAFAIAGQFVAYWLLWLLVVEVPVLVRSVREHGLALEQRFPKELRDLVAVAIGGFLAAALTFVWIQGVPLLMRPVFVWAGTEPTYDAIAPIQLSGNILIAAAAILGVLAALVRVMFGDRRVSSDAPDKPVPSAEGPLFAIAGKVISYGLIVLGVGGLITGYLDVALLVVTLIVTPFIARWLAELVPYRSWIGGIPVVVRFLIGFAITYVAGLVIAGIVFDPFAGSVFFPVVLTLAVGFLVFEILLGPEDETASPGAIRRRQEGLAGGAPRSLPPGATAAIVGALAAIVYLAFPATAFADNCSEGERCNLTPASVAATAAAGAGIVTLSRMALRGRSVGRVSRGAVPPVETRAAGVAPSASVIEPGTAVTAAGATALATGALAPGSGGGLPSTVNAAPDAAESTRVAGAQPSAPEPGGAVAAADAGTVAGTPAAAGAPTVAGAPSAAGTDASASIGAATPAASGPAVGPFLQAELADFTATGGAGAPDEERASRRAGAAATPDEDTEEPADSSPPPSNEKRPPV